MNSKMVKALRKVAHNAATISAAENKVEIKEREYVENESGRRYGYKPILDEKGEQVFEEDGFSPKFDQILLAPGTLTLNPLCVRAVYRDMKKKIKQDRLR